MISLLVILTILYVSQLSRGVLGKEGIVSATKFYKWEQVDSVDWITGLQAENPGYPSWGLVRFHADGRIVEYVIKTKVEEEIRSFVEKQLAVAKNSSTGS